MAYQGIGTGTLPNDDTGDNLRDAGIKINDNFSELYSHFGDGTNLTAIVGTGIATESGIVGTGVTLIEFKGSAVGEVVVGSGIATITVSDFQESLYGDTDVNTHLNLSSAGANEVLSYDGSDYTWVSNAGYTNSNVDTHLNQSTATSGQVLGWNGTDYDWVDQSGGFAVQEEGSDVGTATTINFVGTGVTATFDSGIATVSIIGIPTDTGDLTNNAGYITAGSTFSGDYNSLTNKPTLFSGNYSDLTDKPTIPADTGDLTNNVGFITSGDSGAGLTALTGAEQGTYGNGTNSAQITVDANGRITSIGQVAISGGGGGGGGISGINVYDNEDTSLGVTTNISFNNNLDVVSIGDTFTVSVSGVVTSLVGYATEGYVDNAVVGLATTGALVGLATTGALVGLATTGDVFSGDYTDLTNKPTIPTDTGDLTNNVGFATTGALVGFITSGDSGAGLTGLTGATEGTWGNATNVAEITVDANGRITGISNVAISGGGGGGGISGINVYDNENTSLGVTTNINFGDNLNAIAIGDTVTVSVTGVVTSVVGLATTGALVGLATTGALVGLATTGALVGLATTGDVFSGDYNDLTNKPTIPASQDLDNVLGVGNTSSTGMSVGLVTATALSGFEYLQAPHGTTVEFAVTVASKTSAHRYPGGGSSSTNAYFIDGVESPFLTLTPGRTYRFTNNNTGSHPLKFYLEADKTTEYTSGVNFQNSYTEITVSDETPTVLHYQCTAHGYMGNAVQTNSNKVNSPYGIVGAAFSTASGTSSQFLKADGSVDSSTYLTSLGTAILDGDFTSNGFMKRTGDGTYETDNSTYLTSYAETDTLDSVTGRGDNTTNGIKVGVITATELHTGAEGSSVRVTSDSITGPSTITIDPAAVGDNTGDVRIKGNLYVDGTTTQINSTTIELADFIVGIATTATTDVLADGAGIQIGPDNTLKYEHSNTALKSSENLNLAADKTYKINGTDVLSATTLGSGVTNSSLTSVGTLEVLNVTGIVTGAGFSTAGGTSSQFLKADGSVDSNTYLTSETSHSDVLVDGDFGSEGFMKRGATSGTYSIDSNTYLTTTGDGSSLTGIPTDGDFTSNGLMKRTGAGTYSIDSNTYLTTESDPIVAAINGIVKSDGSTISTATSGTDYLAPSSDGSSLTGIVTSIVAGTNITLTGGPTGIITINSGTATTTGTFPATAGVAYTANTYTSSDFVTTEYTLFFQHSSGIQSQKVLVMDDETTAYSQEYAIMSSNSPLVSVGATIKSSNVELWFTPEPGVSGIITYKFTRETIS